MKIKYLLFVLILVCNSLILHSQTNERIKKESDKNKEKSENSNDDNGSTSSSSGESSSDDSESSSVSASIFFELIKFMGMGMANGLSEANTNIKENEEEVPRINSVDLNLNTGYINPNSTLLMPSVKFRGGLYSTHLRIFSNTEHHLNGSDNYTTVNWQIIQFNPVVDEFINLSLGYGFLYETYSQQYFNEFGLGFEFYPADKFYIPVDFRYTPDFSTDITMMSEVHAGIGYTVKKWKHNSLRFELNYSYAKYYEAVNVNSFSFGINFLLDTGESAKSKPEDNDNSN